MASLPSQHPHLALHLTDRALTPIISSSSSSVSTTTPSDTFSSKGKKQQKTQQPRRRNHPTFSTSPLSPSSSDQEDDSDSDSDDNHSSSENDESEPSANEKSQALSHLTSTALASYDTAKRLGKGAPIRTMVEYGGNAGPVVLHSYMCPMSLALGVPGRKSSHDSLRTGAGVGVDEAADSGGGGGGGRGEESAAAAGDNRNNGEAPSTTNKLSQQLAIHNSRSHSPARSSPSDDGQDHDSPNAPPMLIGTVVAPKGEDLRDARRAAVRMERVAKIFQTEWLSTAVASVEGAIATGPGGAGDGVGTGT